MLVEDVRASFRVEARVEDGFEHCCCGLERERERERERESCGMGFLSFYFRDSAETLIRGLAMAGLFTFLRRSWWV
jgi:hypothetical protein